MKRAILSLVLLALGACGPYTPPKPAPTGDDFADACANMQRLGDPAGDEPDCALQLERVEEQGIVSMEPKCLAAADTKAQLDACNAE